MEIETVATPSNDMTPKRSGRKPGSPKVPGSGRIKGKPAGVPENIRAVCREVLGLENLAIRKRLKGWLESGDGLGSMTFRHVLTMGYGQPKHTMETGEAKRQSLIFLGVPPWDPRLDSMKPQVDAMIAASEAEEKLRALEEAKKPVVIDVDKNDSEVPETLERVSIPEPPDNPEAFR